MASFDDIPLEVQEQIFLHLTPADLKECSFVCLKWHDIINSNQIWLKMCALEGLVGKRFLDDSFSLIQNPIKQYPNEMSLGPLCHWRSHFNRYKYIKRNWRTGYFSRAPIRFTPIYISEKYVIQLKENSNRKDSIIRTGWSPCHLVIWEVCGSLQKFCTIDLLQPDNKVENLQWKGEFIVYTQQRNVVCLKRGKNAFREVLQIKLESGNCSQMRSSCIKPQLTIRLSEKFLLIQDYMSPCSLSFYDCNKGKLIRKLDLHRTLGNQSIYCSCLEVIDDKVFLAYKMSSNSFVVKYDFTRDSWETPVSLPNEAVELYLSRRFVCVKLSPESRDTPVSILQVWDHLPSPHPTEEVSEFYASKHLPVVLTDDDLVIFHTRDEIKIHGLLNDYMQSFVVSRGVMKFVPIWNKYLVILDERGVSVWDWKVGKKINTPFRDDCCSTFYVSETNIVVRRDDEQFYIISYW